jgi:hypothetical protein
LRLTIARLLDRGWDAHWVLAQPLYVLVGMLEALANDASKNKQQAQNPDGSSSRKFVVDHAARKARQAAREKMQVKEKNE